MLKDWRWLAAAVPALAAAWALARAAAARRDAVAKALGRLETVRRCADDAASARALRARLRLGALACLFLALAGPRWGVELVETRSDARQVVVAVDVSLSMQARDLKPSRLERAKDALSLLLDQLKGERVGVVAFAGEAQVVCPVTSDTEAAKQLLSVLEPGAIAVPGTAVGSAIRLAASMLGRYPGTKAVVLLTDGEDHGTDPVSAAREAASAGVRVYTVGVGTPEGEPIPVGGPGEYKKDAKGATVVTRLGEKALVEAAEVSGGAYYRSTPGEEELAEIVARIKGGAAAKGLAGSAARWKDRAALPLALAFLLLLAELLVPLAPARATRRAAPAAPVAAALTLLLAPAASAATAEGELRAGNRAYADGRHADALERYGRAAGRRPKDARPLYNAGAAFYRLERHDDASAAWGEVAGRGDAARAVRAGALYNLGGARYRAGDYRGAAAAYRAALALDPSDLDARRNLAVALKRLRQPPPPRSDDKKKDDQDQDKKQGGEDRPKPDKPRPQDSLTKDEAEQVMRAVAEREKAAQKDAARRAQGGRSRHPGKEDW